MKAREVAVKAISYRVVSAVQTISLAYFIFGDLSMAGAFGVADMALNTFVYGSFEFGWDRARRRRHGGG